MKDKRKFVKKAFFLPLSAVACAALCLWRNGGNAPTSLLISDALTLAAAFFLSAFALIKISRSGFFDTLAYSLSRAAQSEDFVKYCTRKKEEAARKDSPLHLLTAGIILLLGAIAFTAAFYSSSTDTTPGI